MDCKICNVTLKNQKKYDIHIQSNNHRRLRDYMIKEKYVDSPVSTKVYCDGEYIFISVSCLKLDMFFRIDETRQKKQCPICYNDEVYNVKCNKCTFECCLKCIIKGFKHTWYLRCFICRHQFMHIDRNFIYVADLIIGLGREKEHNICCDLILARLDEGDFDHNYNKKKWYCKTCNKEVNVTSKTKHRSSTLHKQLVDQQGSSHIPAQ